MSTQDEQHYVDDRPYNSDDEALHQSAEALENDAPGWVLVWRRFRKHRVAFVSGLFLLLCYAMLPFVGFIAPYSANERDAEHLYAPPQGISFFHEGRFIGPHVYPSTAVPDLSLIHI